MNGYPPVAAVASSSASSSMLRPSTMIVVRSASRTSPSATSSSSSRLARRRNVRTSSLRRSETAAGDHIDLAAVHAGIPAARKRLGSTVHATALADLSAVDRTYLLAMAQDAGPSKTGEIARRLGEDVHYAGQY